MSEMPTFTPLGTTPPNRSMLDDVYVTAADSFAAWMPTIANEMGLALTWTAEQLVLIGEVKTQAVNDIGAVKSEAISEIGTIAGDAIQQAQGYAHNASANADAAAESASDAAQAQALAESLVNFVGRYEDLEGTLTKKSTVLYNDGFWVLLNDLADVTASVPSDSNPDWKLAQGTIRVKTTPIGAPDWPCTLTYDENGNLSQALYSQNNTRFRETITYSDGDISSVLYEQSADSGSTWSVIGTEIVNYDGVGTITSTYWTEGA
tara:strand:+ start:30478 stop:31266 length:789 start_codon:yes stop_codon:yes gene_type:complete